MSKICGFLVVFDSDVFIWMKPVGREYICRTSAVNDLCDEICQIIF